ncbi:MAG: desulfoferrodoxin [Bacteroidales bacterium]|nr:desulfoferrodoxin [Bacteroidales bacterium]
MTKKLEVYKCEICGNIVEVTNAGAGTLVCCGQDMNLLKESTADSTTEKHVPFIEKIEGGYKVKVGENVTHPMTEKHYIQWIELLTENKVYRKYLTHDDEPEAIFKVDDNEKIISAREYCNLHGLWKFEK